MKDLVHNIKVLNAWAQAQITATGNSGKIIDRQGFYSFTLVFLASAAAAISGSNYFTVVFQEGNDAGGSDMTDITDQRRYLYNSETVPTARIDAIVADGVFKIGLALSSKRYIRVRLVETGTADVTGTALAILGSPTHAPVVQ